MEIRDEKLKKKLISFRNDLKKVNKDSKRILKKYVPKEDLNEQEKNMIEGFENSIERNEILIDIIESQLKQDFNIEIQENDNELITK